MKYSRTSPLAIFRKTLAIGFSATSFKTGFEIRSSAQRIRHAIDMTFASQQTLLG